MYISFVPCYQESLCVRSVTKEEKLAAMERVLDRLPYSGATSRATSSVCGLSYVGGATPSLSTPQCSVASTLSSTPPSAGCREAAPSPPVSERPGGGEARVGFREYTRPVGTGGGGDARSIASRSAASIGQSPATVGYTVDSRTADIRSRAVADRSRIPGDDARTPVTVTIRTPSTRGVEPRTPAGVSGTRAVTASRSAGSVTRSILKSVAKWSPPASQPAGRQPASRQSASQAAGRTASLYFESGSSAVRPAASVADVRSSAARSDAAAATPRAKPSTAFRYTSLTAGRSKSMSQLYDEVERSGGAAAAGGAAPQGRAGKRATRVHCSSPALPHCTTLSVPRATTATAAHRRDPRTTFQPVKEATATAANGSLDRIFAQASDDVLKPVPTLAKSPVVTTSGEHPSVKLYSMQNIWLNVRAIRRITQYSGGDYIVLKLSESEWSILGIFCSNHLLWCCCSLDYACCVVLFVMRANCC